jgi:hypothetical protein
VFPPKGTKTSRGPSRSALKSVQTLAITCTSKRKISKMVKSDDFFESVPGRKSVPFSLPFDNIFLMFFVKGNEIDNSEIDEAGSGRGVETFLKRAREGTARTSSAPLVPEIVR